MIFGCFPPKYRGTSINYADSEAKKIECSISKLEEEIGDLYLQLGKAYFQTHKEVPADEYAEMVRRIGITELEITDYRTQLGLLKGVVCPCCGLVSPPGALYCAQDGGKLPLDLSRFERCRNCGRSVKKGLSNCVFCGKPMVKSEL